MSSFEIDSERRLPKITPLGMVICFGLLGLLAAMVLPTVLRERARGRMSVCGKSNLHYIGVSLEIYSKDFDGRYPEHLSQLTPEYVNQVPMCPENESPYVYEIGKVGYNADGRFEDYYFLYCKDGHPSVGIPAGYPRYDSEFGLIER